MTRFALALLLAAAASAAEPALTFDLTLVEASGDAPMIAMWLEKSDGSFVKTLQIFSKDHKYYKDMLVWTAAREGNESKAQLDAVVGPTITWGQSRHLAVPLSADGIDLLAGDLVLRIEQRKDKGGHYKKRKIPLTADYAGQTIEKEGYIGKLVIAVSR
jgi:hypothetical protein